MITAGKTCPNYCHHQLFHDFFDQKKATIEKMSQKCYGVAYHFLQSITQSSVVQSIHLFGISTI